MTDDNLDFINRVKEIEREFNSDENKDNTLNNETKKSESQQGETPQQRLSMQPRPQTNTMPSINSRHTSKKKQKKSFLQGTIWGLMLLAGLGGALLLYMTTLANTLFDVNITTVRPINEIALIITSIPLAYFIIVFSFGSPTKPISTPVSRPAATVRPQTASPQVSSLQSANLSNEESQDIILLRKQLEAEKEELRFQRTELEKQQSKIDKYSLEQQRYDHERKLLDERRYQIESLMGQNISDIERNNLESELKSIADEIKKFEEKMQDIQQRESSEPQIISSHDIIRSMPEPITSETTDETESKTTDETVPQKDNSYYAAERFKFEEELNTLKNKKQEILLETKNIKKQADRTAASIELLKTKRNLAVEKQNELKQSEDPKAAAEISKIKSKIAEYDEQKASLKEKELQDKTQLAEVQQKELDLEQQVHEVRNRIAAVLNELKEENKARMEDIKQMQKVYTDSISLIKKPGVKKQTKKEG